MPLDEFLSNNQKFSQRVVETMNIKTEEEDRERKVNTDFVFYAHYCVRLRSEAAKTSKSTGLKHLGASTPQKNQRRKNRTRLMWKQNNKTEVFFSLTPISIFSFVV